jgi:hypothetical protein
MHEVVHHLAQHGDFGMVGYLEFRDPSVIGNASITDPVDVKIGIEVASVGWNNGYNDTGLGKKRTLASRAEIQEERLEVHIAVNCRSCEFVL